MRRSLLDTIAAVLLFAASLCAAAQEAPPAVKRAPPVPGSVVPAKYPYGAKEAGEEGVVRLRVRVDATGWTTDVTVLESSGYPRLDKAALEAVSRWRYRPGTIDGVASAMDVNVPIRFTLKSPSSQ